MFLGNFSFGALRETLNRVVFAQVSVGRGVGSSEQMVAEWSLDGTPRLARALNANAQP